MLFVKKVSLSLFLASCFTFTLNCFNDVVVDPTDKLSQGEINYIEKREPLVHKALEQFVQKPISQYKKIGLCYSGGGYRSMISSLGFMLAAQDIGLRPAATYDASLSGSTWNHLSIFIRKIFAQQRKNLEKLKQEDKNPKEIEKTETTGFFSNTWGYFTAIKNYLPSMPSFFSRSKNKEIESPPESNKEKALRQASPFAKAKFILSKVEGEDKQDAREEEESFLEALRKKLKERVSTKFWNPFTLNWHNILEKLEKKHETYGHFKPADLWGALLTDRLLGDLPDKEQNFSFADIRAFLEETDTEPFPLFSSCIKNCPPMTQEYDWFEITPYASGSNDLKGFIPTEYLGSFFANGKLVKPLKEESLSFLMGVLGSAYVFNIGDPLLLLAQAIPTTYKCRDQVIQDVKKFIKKYDLCSRNFLPSRINNPTNKMESSPFSQPFIELADAGYDYNLTMPPLLRRKTDIILCCDASTDACTNGFPEMQKAKKYAAKHGFAFPALQYYKQIDKHLYLFKWDEKKQTSDKIPTIFYFTNPYKESTLKLEYSGQEFDEVCDFMRDNLAQNKNAIITEILAKCE